MKPCAGPQILSPDRKTLPLRSTLFQNLVPSGTRKLPGPNDYLAIYPVILYMPLDLCISTSLYLYISIYRYLSIAIYLYLHLYLLLAISLSLYVYIYIYIYIQVYIYFSLSLYIYIYVCIYIYIHTDVHILHIKVAFESCEPLRSARTSQEAPPPRKLQKGTTRGTPTCTPIIY